MHVPEQHNPKPGQRHPVSSLPAGQVVGRQAEISSLGKGSVPWGQVPAIKQVPPAQVPPVPQEKLHSPQLLGSSEKSTQAESQQSPAPASGSVQYQPLSLVVHGEEGKH